MSSLRPLFSEGKYTYIYRYSAIDFTLIRVLLMWVYNDPRKLQALRIVSWEHDWKLDQSASETHVFDHQRHNSSGFFYSVPLSRLRFSGWGHVKCPTGTNPDLINDRVVSPVVGSVVGS